MAKVALDLTDAQAHRLRDEAARLGLPAEELARAAVVDLIERGSSDFSAVAVALLRKNAELYDRLS